MAEQSPGAITNTRRISTALPYSQAPDVRELHPHRWVVAADRRSTTNRLPIATGEPPRRNRTPARLLRLPIFELAPTNRQGLTGRRAALSGPNGGRIWWAHFEFTRMNIELTILSKKF